MTEAKRGALGKLGKRDTIGEQLNAPLSDPTRETCGESKGFVGYTCTRNANHLGPCALVPLTEGEFADTRDAIGQLLNDELAERGQRLDSCELDVISQAIIAKLRPDLIPVAKPEKKRTVMDGQLVHLYLAAMLDAHRMDERHTWTSTFKHDERTRRAAQQVAIECRKAMLASEREVDE